MTDSDHWMDEIFAIDRRVGIATGILMARRVMSDRDAEAIIVQRAAERGVSEAVIAAEVITFHQI